MRDVQPDMDGDGLGDACDECPLVVDETNAYTAGIPGLGIEPAPLAPDSDDDGTPDACDDTPYGGGILVDGARASENALRPGVSEIVPAPSMSIWPRGRSGSASLAWSIRR